MPVIRCLAAEALVVSTIPITDDEDSTAERVSKPDDAPRKLAREFSIPCDHGAPD
jgi:hypothetical protein